MVKCQCDFCKVPPPERAFEQGRIFAECESNQLTEKDYDSIFQEQDKQIALLKAHDPGGMIDWDTYALGIDGLPITVDELRENTLRCWEDEALRMLIAVKTKTPYEPRLQYCLKCGCNVELKPIMPKPIPERKAKKPGVELW